MINDPKPFGVTAGRLWFEAHLSRYDPKIADPYATQIAKEIDGYIARAIVDAKAEERVACAHEADLIAQGRDRQSAAAMAAGRSDSGKISRDFQSMALSAADVADAIRKRGGE